MTARSRRVLTDCRLVLTMLEDEKDLPRWRIHWFAALALVRAVGHVLDKVDGTSPAIREAARAAHRLWKSDAPEHEIFREFIERERNTILKEYKFNTHPSDEIALVLVRTLQRVSVGALIHDAQLAPIGDNIHRPLLSGFREGDDARDVLSDAIDWREAELSAIDAAVRLEGKRV